VLSCYALVSTGTANADTCHVQLHRWLLLSILASPHTAPTVPRASHSSSGVGTARIPLMHVWGKPPLKLSPSKAVISRPPNCVHAWRTMSILPTLAHDGEKNGRKKVGRFSAGQSRRGIRLASPPLSHPPSAGQAMQALQATLRWYKPVEKQYLIREQWLQIMPFLGAQSLPGYPLVQYLTLSQLVLSEYSGTGVNSG